ncbi:MAG: branched-chain amino acid aminotransferase [Alphaproteobacteria bacterium]|nr:branched-chain amino acid aminotransferase [Alphaproteobacteria bacterium]
MTRAVTYAEGKWHEGNPRLVGPMTHGLMLSGFVFDGARAFEDTTPDLDLHCQRAVHSAIVSGFRPDIEAGAIHELAQEGVAKFDKGTQLYIRPVFYAESGAIAPDPDSTRFMVTVYEAPLPDPTKMKAHVSRYRRPSPETAPTDAKISSLYTMTGRVMKEANDAGFDNAVMLDLNGNVTEFATSNLFMVKDGVIATPAWNGTFLNGITRRRVIKLLRDAGHRVEETRITVDDLMGADEIFSSGNYGKVGSCTGINGRDLQPGPVFRETRQRYWDYAHETAGKPGAALGS